MKRTLPILALTLAASPAFAHLPPGEYGSFLAGVTHPSQVYAVVFETTGDVAVLKTCDEVDPWLFGAVRSAEHLGLGPAPDYPAGHPSRT